jgi:hypothetical protein
VAESEHVSEPVKNLLPERIEVANANDLSVSPNELRALKAATGRTMTALMGDDADDEDRMQAVVWLELRRRGYRPTWDEAGDVSIAFGGSPPESDPTPTATSTG